MSSDNVDTILAQWQKVRPDLDCSAMGVVGRLRRINNIWKNQIDQVFKAYGLSSIEFDILATLRRSSTDGITPTELYKTLMLSSGAVSTRLEQLVKAELVVRMSSEHDRRSCKVALTDKGIKLVDNVLDGHVSNMDEMLNALNKQEQAELASLLSKVLIYEQSQP